MSGILSVLQVIFYYPIFNVLMFLNWLVHDLALSIVLLTLVVRAAMIPLTRKQLQSQRRMMEIQPMLNQLKEQYKGDQQGFAKAQMQLMKEQNVSMFGGCLPLLIQLPFLYGLFYALKSGLGTNIASVRHDLYPFMQFTLNHGLPDAYLRWFAWLPGHPVLNLNLPDPTHILPIVAALFTFISVRQMQGSRQMQQAQAARAKPSDPKAAATQNAQTQMMGMMTYITPLFTLFFAWQYAAGLALYWTVSTLFGFGQQFVINGWGGTFKGIPRLDEWAKQRDARREARRMERRQASGGSTLGNVVEGTASAIRSLAPQTNKIGTNSASNGVTKSAKETSKAEEARSGDWIEQAKTENQGTAPKRKERPKPFVTLVPTPPTGPLSETPTADASAENGTNDASTGATNGAKANGVKANASTGSSLKSNSLTNTPKTGTPSAKRKVPPRSGSLPKPKGGKK